MEAPKYKFQRNENEVQGKKKFKILTRVLTA